MYTANANSTKKFQVFSEAPTISLVLPGWVSTSDYFRNVFGPEFLSCSFAQSLRHSLARVLSYYRTSSVVSSQHGAVHDFEKGVLGSERLDFGIPQQHATFHLGFPNGKRGEEFTLPALPIEKGRKPQHAKKRASFWIRLQLWFNTYRCVFLLSSDRYRKPMATSRKFFTLIVTLNIVGLVLAILGKWQYPRKYTGALVLGNLVTAILARNELFGRLLYLLTNTFAKVCIGLLGHRSDVFAHVLKSQWTPLWFRLGCTSTLQHLGGIHSGCATSSFAWLIFHLVRMFNDRVDNPGPVLLAGVVTSVFVAVCIASAFPWVRNTHHKYVVGCLKHDDLKQSVLVVSLSDTTGSGDGSGSCSVSEGYSSPRFK